VAGDSLWARWQAPRSGEGRGVSGAGRRFERLASWTAPIRAELDIELAFPERNGAQRQRRRIEAGGTREEVFAASVAETRQTYAEEVAV